MILRLKVNISAFVVRHVLELGCNQPEILPLDVALVGLIPLVKGKRDDTVLVKHINSEDRCIKSEVNHAIGNEDSFEVDILFSV